MSVLDECMKYLWRAFNWHDEKNEVNMTPVYVMEFKNLEYLEDNGSFDTQFIFLFASAVCAVTVMWKSCACYLMQRSIWNEKIKKMNGFISFLKFSISMRLIARFCPNQLKFQTKCREWKKYSQNASLCEW